MCLAPGLASCPGCCPLGVTDAPTRRRTSSGVSSTQPQGQRAPPCPTLRHGTGGRPRGGHSKAKSPRTSPSPMPSGACSSPKSIPAGPGVSLGAARFGDSSCCYLEPSAGTPHGSPLILVSVKEQKQHLHLCSLSPREQKRVPTAQLCPFY